LDPAHDLTLVGEAILLMFAEEQLAVDHDIENPAGPTLKLSLDPDRRFEFRCETRSAGFVVSNPAIVDPDVHRSSAVIADAES
jgi:hypothetical protein